LRPERRSRRRISRFVNNWPSSTGNFTGRNCVGWSDSSGRLSQLWQDWREVLIIVKPETVIKWRRQGFKLYWRWKSKAPVGRPKIDKEIRELIRKMSRENPLWGVPRIQAELRLLGFDLAESTVAKYRVRGSASPSQPWKTFLSNHAKQIAAIDFIHRSDTDLPQLVLFHNSAA
jgi:hypothetical protein